MKKILVAAALAFVASTASATIANSRHDFQTNGYVTPAPTSACLFCHTPHNAVSNAAPIWARNLVTPTAYYVSTIGGPNNTSVSVGGVNTCLGCHATGSIADMGTTIAIPAGNGAIIGTDLSTSHPVGNQTLFLALATTSTKDAASISLGGLTPTAGDQMTCGSCHDVHNTTTTTPAGTGLLRAFTGDFCLACHTK